MATLSQIRGQDRAVAQLESAIAGGRVAHAYLFAGPAGSGKYETALALARALDCESAPGRGCDTCIACSKIAAGIHPDVQVLEPQGAASIIPIDTIRTRLIPQLGMPPHEGKARVFIIREAAALQGPSANALLKTLEEPPARTHFILATTAPDQLLPTIRSRCQRIQFVAPSPELAALRAEAAGDEESSGDLVERARALAGELHDAATSGDFDSLERAGAAVSSDKEAVALALDLLAWRLHDEAVRDARDGVLDEAARKSRQAHLVLETQQAISLQAHAQLAVEGLLDSLRKTL